MCIFEYCSIPLSLISDLSLCTSAMRNKILPKPNISKNPLHRWSLRVLQNPKAPRIIGKHIIRNCRFTRGQTLDDIVTIVKSQQTIVGQKEDKQLTKIQKKIQN